MMAMVATGTSAYFSNTEHSTGDLITAGTLNLVDTITGSATNASVATTDGADSINDTVNFGATDPIRPGSSGVVTWTLNNTGNLPGTLTIVSTATFSEGAAPNEPELAADADSSQGLDDELLVWVTLNNGTTTSAVLGTEAEPVALSGLAEALSLQSVQMGRVTVDTNATLIYVLHWNVPAETVGNEIQGDSATLNVAFTLTQNDAIDLFSSDLNSLNGFTQLIGSWTAANGVLSPSVVFGEHRLAVVGGPWQDFNFQTTATITSGGSGYGLYYRCDSNPAITGYVFQLSTSSLVFQVRKVVSGYEFPPFQSVNMPAGFQINMPHNVSVSIQGDHHVIKVDGITVFDFHDSRFSSGTVGLRSWSVSNVNFTFIKVSSQ